MKLKVERVDKTTDKELKTGFKINHEHLSDEFYTDKAWYVDELYCVQGHDFEDNHHYDEDEYLKKYIYGDEPLYFTCRALRKITDVEGKTYLEPHEKIDVAFGIDIDGSSLQDTTYRSRTPFQEIIYRFNKPSVCFYQHEFELECRDMADEERKRVSRYE